MVNQLKKSKRSLRMYYPSMMRMQFILLSSYKTYRSQPRRMRLRHMSRTRSRRELTNRSQEMMSKWMKTKNLKQKHLKREGKMRRRKRCSQ